MELGTILRVARDGLREKYGWKKSQCRITAQGEPLELSPEFFVGIHDAGIEGGVIDGYYLEETYRIEVSVWRRLGQYPKDRLDDVLIDEDPHLVNVDLPSRLEKQVKDFIHFSYPLMNAINQAYGAPSEENGPGLLKPFIYQGSTRTKTLVVNDGGTKPSPAYAGRTLRFGGAQLIAPICTENQ
ncbi:MAG: hypothetical protein ACIALR_05470 [Blastopirellula sp. JB062]